MDKDDTSEIAKLTERISKDPKSKLFVPLAEEYKKAGDLEMSILVLNEGLKNNPGYVTARSFLGRLLLEKGDLPGAQKEFEEVVKAIPDNLMAQRKLGDLYAHQNRTSDALGHYKIALSLNPKDSETAFLIAEAEAGRDIKKHLSKLKPAATEEQQKKQETPQTGPPAAVQKPQQATITAKVQAPKSAAKEEEPEEVLVVEPLEPAPAVDLDQELAAKNLGFLTETAQELPPAVAEEEKRDALFSLNEPFADQAAELEEPAYQVEDPFAIEAEGEAEQEKQADDFTTDTLAELYISQGFFEKAVDIYERMLVDKPNSQGLKDKLTKVRAMAASDASEEEVNVGKPDSEKVPELDAYIPPPRLDDFELPATQAIPALDYDAAPPVKQPGQPNHFDVGFEAKEYVPPDAVSRQSPQAVFEAPLKQAERESVEQTADQNSQSPVKSRDAKKETVERLESWLKNIKKET